MFSCPYPSSLFSGVYKPGIDERLIRLEEGQKALNQRFDDMNQNMNQRFDGINQKFGDMMGIMLGGFGVLFAGMFTLIGFVIWDRRTTVAPVAKKVKVLEQEEEMILKALKGYANIEPKMHKVLTNVGFYKEELPVSA